MSVIVFTGPTLSPIEVRQVIEADCLAPVAQGDVYRAALRRPRVIGIIDGYFERVPSVWHKEILWAMSQGIHVFGSASMGALRAAELWPFGMVGVGAVFESYRDGVLEDDDEVAVAHGPTEGTYRFCSEAMVNIRATLAQAVVEGVLGPVTRESLVRIAKDLFYQERRWERILELAVLEQVPSLELKAFRQWLPGGAVNQKREDAFAMLREIRELLAANPGHKRVSFAFEETLYWEAMVRDSGEIRIESDGGADGMVLDELRRDPEALASVEAAALGWQLAAEQARREGHVPQAVDLLERSREFCDRHGLVDAAGVAGWLQRNHCGSETVEHLLEARMLALEAKQRAPSALAACVLDHLRWTGDYTVLLERACSAKRSRPLPHPRSADSP